MAKQWSDAENDVLKSHYNEDYEELVKRFEGRTVRSLKHQVGVLGLKRSERRRWSDEELNVLRENTNLTPRQFVDRGLLDRDVVQIAARLRDVRGTARSGLKKGWDVPSKELAYLLGAICSDGGLYKYHLEFRTSKSDSAFLDRVQWIIEETLGLEVKRSTIVGKLPSGESREYGYLGVYRKSLLEEIGDSQSVAAGNVRGAANGEWIDFINAKWSWILKEPFLWSFLSGLMDGDGNVGENKVSIAVAPERTAQALMRAIEETGYEVVRSGISICINGGNSEREEFLKKLDCTLERKRHLKSFVVEADVKEGLHVQEVRVLAIEHLMREHHYIGTVPAGTPFAFFKDAVMIGAAVIGNPPKSARNKGLRVTELKRFVLIPGLPANTASECLGLLLRRLKEGGKYDKVVSFADPAQGHTGTIYKATNWNLIGKTGSAFRFVAQNGKVYAGRYAADMAKADGVNLNSCTAEITEGKLKFEYTFER